MKLAGYYTSLKKVGFNSPNPKAVYINLSLSDEGRRLKTHVITNGHVIDIPRWVMIDYLRIGEILLPKRKFMRQHKDRLTVSPELVEMLKECGYRYGSGVGQHARIGAPIFDNADVTIRSFAEGVREDVQDKKLTINDMLQKIIESYHKVLPLHEDDGEAIRDCMSLCGWNKFEISMALYWHSKSNSVATGATG